MAAKVFHFNQIESLFSSSSIYHALVEQIKKGFINYSNKVVYVAPVIHLGSTSANTSIPQMTGKGDVCLKSGYIVNDKYYVIKIAGGGFIDTHNNNANYPNSGAMLVFSQQTGALNGILLDNGILTELRTAAASALAAKYFAPAKITNIGIVGVGVQSRYQLEMFYHLFPSMHNVYVYGRSLVKCKQYQKDMSDKGIQCVIAKDMRQIGKECNLIIMCTSARSPVLLSEHLVGDDMQYGMHINAIGADSKGKQELDERIISELSDLVIVDRKLQCCEFGELQHAVKHKTVSMEKVIEFGEVLQEENLKMYGRKGVNDRRLTVFDSTGVAVQDVVIAKMVFELLSKNSKL